MGALQRQRVEADFSPGQMVEAGWHPLGVGGLADPGTQSGNLGSTLGVLKAGARAEVKPSLGRC